MTEDAVEPLGRALVVLGLVIVVAGLVLLLGGRIPLLGNLPGDLRIEREHVTVFIPLGTMVVVSIVATVILALLNRR